MLKIMWLSTDADADIWSAPTKCGQGVDFLIFADADIYLQCLWMQKSKQ